jgi:hypothetical protein
VPFPAVHKLLLVVAAAGRSPADLAVAFQGQERMPSEVVRTVVVRTVVVRTVAVRTVVVRTVAVRTVAAY